MRALQSNKVFVSAFRTDKSDEQNRVNHEYAFKMLKSRGFNFQVVRGTYKGVSELAFVLLAGDVKTHEDNLRVAFELAHLYSQESVLEVHNDGTAELHYLDNGYRVERIGTFRAASELEASKRDSFTYEPKSNQYFVID